jgi:hypothetical protein
MKMSDTKPEAMVEAVSRLIQKNFGYSSHDTLARDVLDAAGVPAMLAALRAIADWKLAPYNPPTATAMQAVARKVLDKSFPQRPAQRATDTVESSD